MKTLLAILAVSILLPVTPLSAAVDRGFQTNILVDGSTLSELHGRGSVYVEALRDRSYSIRLTNPLPVRVAVALSVDGRNTIDARHTTARGASKWILGPYESTVISGWQVDGETAREFTFTTESRSYAAWLGDTSNTGVIEAVFYRERQPLTICCAQPTGASAPAREKASGAMRDQSAHAEALQVSKEMAATGMGDTTSHPVTRVAVDLEKQPAARIRIRYEFREQLVSLGLLPRHAERGLSRRERASGFEWCPIPGN